MKKLAVYIISLISSVCFLCVSACAIASSSLIVASSTRSTSLQIYPDAIDTIFTSSQIENLASKLSRVSDATGFNISIVITDDVGSNKSDRAVIDYADLCYERRFGRNSDGILLLINNDTKYDWISTSGECIDYFSDRRIDYIFDYIYDDLVEQDFYYASMNFLDRVENYYYQGPDTGPTSDITVDDKLFGGTWIVAFVILLFIVARAIYKCSYNSYTRLKKFPKASYTSTNNIKYTESTSDFTGTYFVTINSSSSSSSRGGSRSRSSTHRSSSGGRHGGGGRRR